MKIEGYNQNCRVKLGTPALPQARSPASFRREVFRCPLVVAMLLLSLEPLHIRGSSPAPEQPAILDVRAFGAKGDAQTDDTAAFQSALDERARTGGGIVEVPAGRYLIKTHLVIPESVTLEGTWRAPASIGNMAEMKQDAPGGPTTGSILLAVEGAGKPEGTPFIILKSNATLKGMIIFYPEQTKTNPPVAYPWAVATGSGGTENPSIIDVFMVNPYQAVDFGSYETMRHYIRNLYADALYRGIYIDQCMDIGRLENVHLAPFWHWTLESPLTKFVMSKGEGFIFGRTDWQLVNDCFVAIYKVGFRFTRNGPFGISRTGPSTDPKFTGLPTGNVMITGGGADMSDIAVLIEDTQPHAGVSFANCQIFGDIIVQPTNAGPVRFTACGLFGSMEGANGVSLAKIDAGRSRVSFSNCHFYALRNFKDKPLLHVLGGRLSIDNSVFMNSKRTHSDPLPAGETEWNPEHVVLEPGVISALIIGNEFYSKLRVVNHTRGQVMIANNLDQTDPPQ